MSFHLREAVDSLSLPASLKACLGALAKYANKAGVCWPAVATLAADTGLSERTIRRALADLRARGYVTVDAEGGGRRTNRYRLHLDPGHDVRAARSSRPGCPVTTSGEPVIEPIIETAGESAGAEGEEAQVETDLTATAQEITKQWWEARHPRPVGKYLAARSRVREALEAGWTAPEVARALGAFGYVPDRASLVRKLEAVAKIDRARHGDEDLLDYEHNRQATDNPWARPW